MTPQAIINTSVADAHGTLKCLVDNDPAKALQLVADVFAELEKSDRQSKSLRAVLATIGRTALKLMTNQ
ncbi:MAG: hypothetical protein J7K75_08560 [Desulfuromonas sp.]|nr:hypothetical protein [Desulfuromonas sp.]